MINFYQNIDLYSGSIKFIDGKNDLIIQVVSGTAKVFENQLNFLNWYVCNINKSI